MMRRPPVLLVAGTALLTVVLAACGATEPLPSSTQRAPADAASAADGSPAPGGTSGLSEFEARLRDATAREGLLVRTIGAASGGTAADLRLAIGQMRDWADGERTWLEGHPADPCYDAAATKLRAAADAMTASANGFEGYVSASLAPSDDVTRPSMAAAAAGDLQDATQALADAAALAKTARSSCG